MSLSKKSSKPATENEILELVRGANKPVKNSEVKRQTNEEKIFKILEPLPGAEQNEVIKSVLTSLVKTRAASYNQHNFLADAELTSVKQLTEMLNLFIKEADFRNR